MDPTEHALRSPHAWTEGTEDFTWSPPEWRTFTEREGEDIFAETCEALLETGGLIVGPPGTGKSSLTRALLTEMDRRLLPHAETAPTHAGALQVEGITLHRFCHRAFAGGRIVNVPRGCYLIVDEVFFFLLVKLVAHILLHGTPGAIVMNRRIEHVYS